MAFNPFSQEKTDELIKQFRHEFQELKQKDQIEVDEDDKELGPVELLRIGVINQTSIANGLGEMEKYTKRQLNRYARINCCGMKVDFARTDRQPGKKTLQCADHRLCPYCRRKKAEEMISALRYHHNGLDLGHFLRIAEIHESEYDKYSKRAQRAKIKYGKINQPSNRIWFFSNGDESFGEDLIDYDWEDESQVNWDKVIEQIPMGRNISGSIWIKPGPPGGKDDEGEGEGDEEEIEKQMIPYPHFGSNATEREKNLAFHKAAAETETIVASIEELQKALFNLDRIWRENIGTDKCQSFVDYMWISENDIEAWNKAVNVSKNHIENKEDIYNKDDKSSQVAKDPPRELTPVEQLALVK